jgi:hypothetical protein
MIVIVLIIITIFIIHLWAAQDSHIQLNSIENTNPHGILICLFYEEAPNKKNSLKRQSLSHFSQNSAKVRLLVESPGIVCSQYCDYRYGFNGMEKDDEVKNGKGNSYDFGARMYDSRLGDG